jgi:hypothetical protein
MSRPILRGRLKRDRCGAVALIVGLSIGLIFGIVAIVVDVAYLIQNQRFLQASADAAALAGAQYINCCQDGGAKALSMASSYSAIAGARNARSNMTVTMAAGYPQLKCLKTTGVSCGADGYNALIVRQQATIPLFFAHFLGIGSINIAAQATASARGGTPKPLDVMIILDTTLSMNDRDSFCSATREDCALAGVQTLLGLFNTSANSVGLMVFPGLANSIQAQYDYDCSSAHEPTIAAYNANPVYLILGLSTDYQTSSGSLNASSDLVRAVGGGGPGCQQGVAVIGGVGTFYADAISQAQSYLANNGREGVQKAIIILSDGDANAASAPNNKLECHQAITAAQNAAAQGTWVYAISYGSPTAATPASCSTDTASPISACATMQQIASDPSKYYSDDQGSAPCVSAANPMTGLNQIFQDIGLELSNARLLPNGTS